MPRFQIQKGKKFSTGNELLNSILGMGEFDPLSLAGPMGIAGSFIKGKFGKEAIRALRAKKLRKFLQKGGSDDLLGEALEKGDFPTPESIDDLLEQFNVDDLRAFQKRIELIHRQSKLKGGELLPFKPKPRKK